MNNLNKLTAEQKEILFATAKRVSNAFDRFESLEECNEYLKSLDAEYVASVKNYQDTKDPALFLTTLYKVQYMFHQTRNAITNSGIMLELPKEDLERVMSNFEKNDAFVHYLENHREEVLSKLLSEKIA